MSAAPPRIDAESWARLSPLLDEALDLPAAARAQWLADLRPDAADLRAPLAALLSAPAGNLQLPPLAELQATAGPQPGDLIGPYRLLAELGAGGMGTVWRAVRADGLLEREVALKLPHADGLAGNLAARMARERNILGALAHPNIARLYDAGIAADGQPYLALELVHGTRIDRYAATLAPAAQLRLCLQAVRAVAHAHGQLVVHRDIKPSNLLVDERGEVKLLDFGIAKLLDADEPAGVDLTERGIRPMTPGYAAPEQIAGQPAGTRSDVYALGVVLYELLVGRRPYRTGDDTRAALEHAVLHDEPLRPSDATIDPTRRRLLRGDLDTLLLQALKKDPMRRYGSADALADDIEAYLSHRPLRAQPERPGYLLRKWMRRHRVAVAAAGTALAAILAGSGAAFWQAGVARGERLRADEVKRFVVGILNDASPYGAGDLGQVTAIDLVKQARQRLADARISDPAVRIELANLIGESLLSLGDLDAAEPVLQGAADDARRHLGGDHLQTLRARLLNLQLDRSRGRTAAERSELASLLPLLRRHADDDPASLVVGLENEVLTAIDEGRYAAAESAAVEAEQLARTRLGEHHAESVATAILVGMAQRYAGRYDAALASAERAYALTQAAYPGPPLHPRVIEARAMFGRTLADVGRLSEGVAQLDGAAQDAARLFGAGSPMVGVLRQNLVAYRLDLGELAAADADSAEALRIAAATNTPTSYAYAGTQAARGNVLLARRDAAAALALLAPAADTLAQVLGAGHDVAIQARAQQALALAAGGDVDAAAALLATLQERVARNAATRARVAYAHAVVARLRGQPEAATRLLAPILADRDASPRLQRERARARVELGLDQLGLGDGNGAAASFTQALAELDRLETAATPVRADAVAGLAAARAHP
ncbi:MAG: serine/threonine protein kinase [Proteobacteria bacterium]|nr:serine/threonine protein kinase [Pseudomonadota bacterium]